MNGLLGGRDTASTPQSPEKARRVNPAKNKDKNKKCAEQIKYLCRNKPGLNLQKLKMCHEVVRILAEQPQHVAVC